MKIKNTKCECNIGYDFHQKDECMSCSFENMKLYYTCKNKQKELLQKQIQEITKQIENYNALNDADTVKLLTSRLVDIQYISNHI